MNASDKVWVKASGGPIYAANTNGHSVRLARDEVAQVRYDLSSMCYEQGAVAVEGPNAEQKVEVDNSGPTLQVVSEAIRQACIVLMENGDPDTFTTAGRPRVAVVEKLCPEIDKSLIHTALVNEVWAEINHK